MRIARVRLQQTWEVSVPQRTVSILFADSLGECARDEVNLALIQSLSAHEGQSRCIGVFLRRACARRPLEQPRRLLRRLLDQQWTTQIAGRKPKGREYARHLARELVERAGVQHWPNSLASMTGDASFASSNDQKSIFSSTRRLASLDNFIELNE